MICPALKFLRTKHPNDKIIMLFDAPLGRSKLTPEIILKDTDLVDGFIKYTLIRDKEIFKSIGSIFSLYMSLFMKFDEIYYFVECWADDKRLFRDKLFFKSCGISTLRYFDRILTRPKSDETTSSRALEALYRAGYDDAFKLDIRSLSYEFVHSAKPFRPSVVNRYVLSPFSNMPSKDWPLDRYLEISRWLYGCKGYVPVIFGSDDDQDKADVLINQLGFGSSFCGKLDFPDTERKIADCRFYLGNDSGLMHLSAALGLSCFSIFSARDYIGRWLPLGSNHVNMRNLEIECVGCRSSICNNDLYNQCLIAISVNDCKVGLKHFLGKL